MQPYKQSFAPFCTFPGNQNRGPPTPPSSHFARPFHPPLRSAGGLRYGCPVVASVLATWLMIRWMTTICM